MDDIINKVLDIEDRAKKLIEDTKKEEETIRKEYAQKVSDMHEDILARADRKIETITKNENGDAKKICDEIEANAKQSVEKLEALNRDKKEEWIETIYQNIIGR